MRRHVGRRPRGECPACGRLVSVSVSGDLCKHNTAQRGVRCDGSHERPKPGTVRLQHEVERIERERKRKRADPNYNATKWRASLVQRRILKWLQDNHPHDGVGVHGPQLQICRGLEKQGLVWITGDHGKWLVGLTDAGRAWRDERPGLVHT